MPKLINLIGKRFGRLTVIKRAEKDKWGSYKWLCLCDCGEKTMVIGSSLKKNRTKSCGCLLKEKTQQRFTKHNHTKNGKNSRTYNSWVNMTRRCVDPNKEGYEYYGARGIKVCERWSKFQNFLDDMRECPPEYSIDRINNDKGYYKENCRWATRKEQARNKNNNHIETYNGKSQCIAAWAEETGICEETIIARLNRGLPLKNVLTTPIKILKSQSAFVECSKCHQIFAKDIKRIKQTKKMGKQHACSRKCASAIVNDQRRCEPSTPTAISVRKDKEKFPEKNLARSLVRRAIKSGKIIPLEECEFCGSDLSVDGHHPDHSRPFLLLYLCKNCHHQADADPDKWENLATDYCGCII